MLPARDPMRKPKPHFYRFPTAGLFADYRTLPPTELNVFRAARAFLAFADMDTVRMAMTMVMVMVTYVIIVL